MGWLKHLVILFVLFQVSHANFHDYKFLEFDLDDNGDLTAKDVASNWGREQRYNDRRAVVEDELEQLLDSVYTQVHEAKKEHVKDIVSSVSVNPSVYHMHDHLHPSTSLTMEHSNGLHVSSPELLPSSEHNLAMAERSLDVGASLGPYEHSVEHTLNERGYEASLGLASSLSMAERNVDHISSVPSILHSVEHSLSENDVSLFPGSSLHDWSVLKSSLDHISLLPSNVHVVKRTLNTIFPVTTSTSLTGFHSASHASPVVHISKVISSSHGTASRSIHPSRTVPGITASHDHNSHVSVNGVTSSAFNGHTSPKTSASPTPPLSSHRATVPVMTSSAFQHWPSETHSVWGSFPPTRNSGVFGSSVPTHLPHHGSGPAFSTAHTRRPTTSAGWPSHYPSSSNIFPTATDGGMSSTMTPNNSARLPEPIACPESPSLMVKYLSGFPRVDQLNAHPSIEYDSFDDDIEKSLDILALMKDSKMAARELVVMMSERIIQEISHCPTSMVNRIVMYAISRTFQNVTQDYKLRNLTSTLTQFSSHPTRMGRTWASTLYKNMMAYLMKKVHLDIFKGVERFGREVYHDMAFAFEQIEVHKQVIKNLVKRHLYMSGLSPLLRCKSASDLKQLYIQVTDGLFRKLDGKILTVITRMAQHSELNTSSHKAVELSVAFRPLVRHISLVMTAILQSTINGSVDRINRFGHVLSDSQVKDFKMLLQDLGWISESVISHEHEAKNLAEAELYDIKILKSVADDVKKDVMHNLPLIHKKLTALLNRKCDRTKEHGSTLHPVCMAAAANH